MGNKQGKKTNTMIDQENRRLQTENQQFKQTYTPERAAEKKWSDTTSDKIMGGYEKLYGGTAFGDGSGGGGGGYSAPTFQAAQLKLDPRYETLSGDYDKLKGGAHSALSGYDEFAKTGGYSEGDISNIRGRSNSVIPSFYNTLRNRMAQKQNAAGLNMGGIFADASGRMARQAAQGAGQTALDTELGIGDRVREGRRFGIEGQERLGGMGLSGAHSIAGESQRIGDFNEQERVNTANQNASASASASNAAADDRRRDYLTGLGGMQEMWGSSPGELSRYDEMGLANRELAGGQSQSNLGLRAQYNPQRDWWDRITQGVGAASGLAGAWMGR